MYDKTLVSIYRYLREVVGKFQIKWYVNLISFRFNFKYSMLVEIQMLFKMCICFNICHLIGDTFTNCPTAKVSNLIIEDHVVNNHKRTR